MVECSICHKKIADKDALVNKDKDGNECIICKECFAKEVGVDYHTFAYRKENAKQIAISLVLCIAMTAYAFWEKGPIYGAIGIVLTVLIYFFAAKIK